VFTQYFFETTPCFSRREAVPIYAYGTVFTQYFFETTPCFSRREAVPIYAYGTENGL